MLDIGGWEFLLIVVLGIMIIGPKELPGAIRTITTFIRKAREMAREFQWGVEEMAREAELDKVANQITGDTNPLSMESNLERSIENTIDPDGEIRDSMRTDPESEPYEWQPEIDSPSEAEEVEGPPTREEVSSDGRGGAAA